MQPNTTINAAILAGGQSKRMGANKAMLRLTPDGPTVIEMVVDRLREAGFDSILLVANTPDEYAFLRLPTVPDDVPGGGPLGGILTALNHSSNPRALVVACDMPLLNPALLSYMASLPDDADAIVPRWTDPKGQEQLEPLHAIYSRRCIEPLRRRVQTGELKATDFLGDISVTYLDQELIRRYDPDLDSFRNINTSEDWNAFRNITIQE